VPAEERCVVGWIPIATEDHSKEVSEWQLIALTYMGGWYRLALPTHVKEGKKEEGRSSVGGTGSVSGSAGGKMTGKAGPSSRLGPGSPPKSRVPEKGKERERESERRECVLEEYRRFGRWDGWG
jgi:hypothetical protein